MAGALRLPAGWRKQELTNLTRLLEEARQILRENHRLLAVVLSHGEKRLAVSIDLVEAAERIPEERIETMPATMAGRGENRYWRIGKRKTTHETNALPDEIFYMPVGKLIAPTY